MRELFIAITSVWRMFSNLTFIRMTSKRRRDTHIATTIASSTRRMEFLENKLCWLDFCWDNLIHFCFRRPHSVPSKWRVYMRCSIMFMAFASRSIRYGLWDVQRIWMECKFHWVETHVSKIESRHQRQCVTDSPRNKSQITFQLKINFRMDFLLNETLGRCVFVCFNSFTRERV